MAITFKCTHCGKNTVDANVMVNGNYVDAGILWMKVVCKSCTRKLDAGENRNSMHNLWEVGWVVDSPFYLMASVIADLSNRSRQSQKWSEQALDDLFKIMHEAYPNLWKDPISL